MEEGSWVGEGMKRETGVGIRYRENQGERVMRKNGWWLVGGVGLVWMSCGRVGGRLEVPRGGWEFHWKMNRIK
jgi:hypothetical protein